MRRSSECPQVGSTIRGEKGADLGLDWIGCSANEVLGLLLVPPPGDKPKEEPRKANSFFDGYVHVHLLQIIG